MTRRAVPYEHVINITFVHPTRIRTAVHKFPLFTFLQKGISLQNTALKENHYPFQFENSCCFGIFYPDDHLIYDLCSIRENTFLKFVFASFIFF